MKKVLNIVTGDKGGVGKSFLAINLGSYLMKRGIPFAGIDSDNSNSTFTRYFGKYMEKADTSSEFRYIDIKDKDNLDEVIQVLDQKDIVLLDTRAASFDILTAWIDDIGLFEISEELDLMYNIFVLVTPSKDTVAKTEYIMKTIQQKSQKHKAEVNWIVVKNMYLGETFDLYDNSRARSLLTELDGLEMTLPKLNEKRVNILEKKDMTPIEAAEDTELTIMDRQRFKTYGSKVFHEIDGLSIVLTGGKYGPTE